MSNPIERKNDELGNLRRGDAVTVRSLAAILATLDADAKCGGMPFMPEMVPFCGKTFRVFRRAEKSCVEGLGMRSLGGAVFLDGLRCDGSAHDGCQRGCLLFWKTAWLEPAAGRLRSPSQQEDRHSCLSETGCLTHKKTDRNVCPPDNAISRAGMAHRADDTTSSHEAVGPVPPCDLPTVTGGRYYCQSTELAAATSEYPPGRLRHDLHDLWVGEMSLQRFAYLVWMALRNRLCRLLRGRRCHELAGKGQKTASESLDLQPGEWIEVKSAAEIEATLDAQAKNRGLSFEPEMARHCGRRYRVASRIESIIAEESGKMVRLNDTVKLDGIDCQGICLSNCPRANHLYWREIWLRRVNSA